MFAILLVVMSRKMYNEIVQVQKCLPLDPPQKRTMSFEYKADENQFSDGEKRLNQAMLFFSQMALMVINLIDYTI